MHSIEDEVVEALNSLGNQIEEHQSQFTDRLVSGFVSTFEARGIPFDLIVLSMARLAEARGLEGSEYIQHAADILIRERYGLQPPPNMLDIED